MTTTTASDMTTGIRTTEATFDVIFSDTPRTFVEALRYCDSYDYFLPVPQTIEANQQLLKFKGIFYLGITDFESEGVWRSFYTGEIIPFSNWLPGQPNDLHGADYVEFFSMLGGRWNDASGESKRSTLCVKDNLVETTTASKSTLNIESTESLSSSTPQSSSKSTSQPTVESMSSSPSLMPVVITQSSTEETGGQSTIMATTSSTRILKRNQNDNLFDISKSGDHNDRALAALVSWPKEIMIATGADQTATQTSTIDSSYVVNSKSDAYDSFNSVLASSDLGLDKIYVLYFLETK